MKAIKSNVFFYITLFCIFLLSVYAGLADYDYYWQIDLGREIIKNGNFFQAENQIWGTLGKHEYYDHEWLTNVLFYVFSLLGTKAVFWLKLFISAVVGVVACVFVSDLDEQKGLNLIQRFQILLVSCLTSLVFIKVKAYSFSLCFLMIEFIILFHYYEDTREYRSFYTLPLQKRHKSVWVYTLFMLILTILWTNMHSGSMPLMFVVAGLFWLVYIKDIHMIVTGVLCVLATLLNPYGLKLIVFNFKHNGDKVMKSILLDWRPIDAKTAVGIICFILIMVLLYNLVLSKTKDMFVLLLSIGILYLSFTSARHTIYLYPLLVISITFNSDFLSKLSNRLSCNFRYLSLFVICLFLLTSMSTFKSKDFSRDYCMLYHDEELLNIIDKYGYENLYCGNFPYLGVPLFETGAYPACSDRVKDSYLIQLRGSDTNRKDLIEYYGLEKFVFTKWNTDVEYYDLTSGLYDYLSGNSDYVKLYDSDWYCYFIRKDLAYETQ